MNTTKLIGGMPKEYYKEICNTFNNWETRNEHTKNYSWPIVTKECADILGNLLQGRKVLDVAGGNGFITKLLRGRGVDIKLLDHIEISTAKTFYTRIDAHAPLDYSEDILTFDIKEFDAFILSWPCYDAGWAYEFIKRLKSGDVLIYQGESQGGCTADDAFYEYLYSSKFQYEEDISDKLYENHVRFSGIHDNWNIYIVK